MRLGGTMNSLEQRAGPKRKQVHLWLSENDINVLKQLAQARDQTASAFIRGMLRALWRRHAAGRG